MNHFRRGLGSAILLITLWCVAVPFATTIFYALTDKGLRSSVPSKFAMRLHQSVSEQLPRYVAERIASGKAMTLGPALIEATEWPVYGAFFYLLATENLHQDWAAGAFPDSRDPALSGAPAIDASLRIILDEGHAHWVKEYWGENYLTEPNCFYRMLVIGSLTAHHNLTGDTAHLPLLRQLTDDLAADIDASPFGLVDDYPGQCFPADVAVAIAMIRHADTALATDRREWSEHALARLLANFSGALPSYTSSASSGHALTPSRGCTNGFFFTFARHIDRATADVLYANYVERFWQKTSLASGWREFPNDLRGVDDSRTYLDPDSGPVVGGFGTSATGLGLGAARLHGDHQRAGELGAQLIVTSLPFPNGHLFVPSLVGNRQHAPYFPELVILHQLSLSTSGPAPGNASLPWSVWLVLAVEFTVGVLLLRFAYHLARPRAKKFKSQPEDAAPC